MKLRKAALQGHVLESRELGRPVLDSFIARVCWWILALQSLHGSLKMYMKIHCSLFSTGIYFAVELKYNRKNCKEEKYQDSFLQRNLDWKSGKSQFCAPAKLCLSWPGAWVWSPNDRSDCEFKIQCPKVLLERRNPNPSRKQTTSARRYLLAFTLNDTV